MKHLETLNTASLTIDDEAVRARVDDFYIALVGELFALMQAQSPDAADCARIGNALIDIAVEIEKGVTPQPSIASGDARMFGATAFYIGGYPASAYLTAGRLSPPDESVEQACADLLRRRRDPRSAVVQSLFASLSSGDLSVIELTASQSALSAAQALEMGPNEWIPARLLEQLLKRFERSNIRAVLPDGGSARWTPLVNSFLNRSSAAWEFFPSQIEAIQRGLLTSSSTFSLQMPTGAGKTALCETLLFSHAVSSPNDAAVMVVPYRSLASELRGSVVRRLNEMGVSAGCVYGGTIPSGDEVRDLDAMRVLVATPEALFGLLSAEATFLQRISLVICDEGHLLDGDSRGVSLELLLARLRWKSEPTPRFVFVSAIVPNIEEINTWLGGTDESVVRSTYRAAGAEFGVLRAEGSGASSATVLEMHPHETTPVRFQISNFLPASAFRYVNPTTRRTNTFPHDSYKAKAVAAARKVLPLGAVAVFAANKRGRQGVIGLADELLNQLQAGINLPTPIEHAIESEVAPVVDFLAREFGDGWIGTRAVRAGAILHHGDIPQEIREALEELLRRGHIRMAFCTKTLAEGVNLPIRTLVLYSVRRIGSEGRPENLLTRDIKNLVGRAGRAGAATKGLVICVNPDQWPMVERVVLQSPGENVRGALQDLITRLAGALARQSTSLTNEFLESVPGLHSLVDGIDATLLDLAAEEVGEAQLVQIAERIAASTFASSQGDATVMNLLRQVFALRARRVSGLRTSGKLDWIRETGARVRLIVPVESQLASAIPDWTAIATPTDDAMLMAVFEWSWMQREIQSAVRDCFEVGNRPIAPFKDTVLSAIRAWVAGSSFANIAVTLGRDVDETLRIHSSVVAWAFQTLAEQGIALLAKAMASQGRQLPEAVTLFPEHLRHGVPSTAGRVLATAGLRHRRAFVLLGAALDGQRIVGDMSGLLAAAKAVIDAQPQQWADSMGEFVFRRTRDDLSALAQS